jgi:hypothetical protein
MAWEMFGYPKGDGDWLVVDSYRVVKAHGYPEPVPVVVTEDPDGNYLGWIEAEDEKADIATVPIMITYAKIFEINFAYGSAAEEAAGRGRVVRLRVDFAQSDQED